MNAKWELTNCTFVNKIIKFNHLINSNDKNVVYIMHFVNGVYSLVVPIQLRIFNSSGPYKSDEQLTFTLNVRYKEVSINYRTEYRVIFIRNSDNIYKFNSNSVIDTLNRGTTLLCEHNDIRLSSETVFLISIDRQKCTIQLFANNIRLFTLNTNNMQIIDRIYFHISSINLSNTMCIKRINPSVDLYTLQRIVRRYMIEDDHLMLDTGKYRGEEVPEYLINPIE